MSDVQPAGGVQDLWQGQPAEGGALSLDELRTRARWVERRIRRRNLREYVAAVVAVIGFGGGAWIAPTPLIRIGAVPENDGRVWNCLSYTTWARPRRNTDAPIVMMIKATTDAPRAGSIAKRWISSPMTVVAITARMAAAASGSPSDVRNHVVMPPSITNSPCAKFTTSDAL